MSVLQLLVFYPTYSQLISMTVHDKQDRNAFSQNASDEIRRELYLEVIKLGQSGGALPGVHGRAGLDQGLGPAYEQDACKRVSVRMSSKGSNCTIETRNGVYLRGLECSRH